MSARRTLAPSASSTASSRSAASRSSGSPSGSARRRSSPTTGGCSTERIELLRSTLPDGIDLSYAVKANPMPAVVQHLAALVDSLRRRLGRRDARRARHADAGRRGSASPGRARPPAELTQAVAAGVTIEMESATEAERVVDDRRAPRRPAARGACGSTRTSRSRARGCGWAAGRSSSAIDAEQVPALLARAVAAPTSSSSASTSSPARRTSTPRSSARRSARPSSSCSRLADDGPDARSATSTSAAASASPTSRGTSRSTSAAIGENLARPARRRDPPQPARRAGGRSSSAATSSASAGVYVTRVVDRKVSRGKTFLVVDGGMHHQLAASGNFGQVIRRNYPVAIGNRTGERRDRDGQRRRLPVHAARPARRRRRASRDAEIGDLVVVFQAGAYGLTASPTAFLGHPAARRGARLA